MNKNDLKKLAVCGFIAGCLSVAESGVASDAEKTHDDVLATSVEKSQEEIFATGCGGGRCGNKSAPRNSRALTPEEEQQMYQGQGHSCANKGQGQGQGHGCSGRSQPRPYQV